eukprot:TRINITY_DN82987_c0_g1_i2.p1 TRINITY_DN82987_c0_g1~~TRINITY_DN82987_c0_g1_i2.p1  ORF type:complete len:418 (-),score=51.10 TRINITY_DN82987_c0_g1_i2:42-1295(-)
MRRGILATCTSTRTLILAALGVYTVWWIFAGLSWQQIDLAQQPDRVAVQTRSDLPTVRKAGSVEARHFVFIKTFKSASETLNSVFVRFGVRRNLSFAFPLHNKIYLGWPYPLRRRLIRSFSGNGSLDILCAHSVYGRDTTRVIFPPTSHKYITILREPWSHAVSAFHYFDVSEVMQALPGSQNMKKVLSSQDPLADYLEHWEESEQVYTSRQVAFRRFCVPDGVSVLSNLQARSLGISQSHDLGRELKLLDSEFDLVMIMEYFYESLVLLKHVMRWQLSDLLFLSRGIGEYKQRPHRNSSTLHALHRKYSAVDYALYHHFNASFWRRVASMPASFFDEVQEFRSLQRRAEDFCKEVSEGHSDGSLTLPASQWSEALSVSPELCAEMDVTLEDVQKREELRCPKCESQVLPSGEPFFC